MTWNINAVQGGTITRRLTFTNDDGTPVLTDGWTWRAGLRGSSVSIPVAVTVISSGVIEVTVTALQTASLEPGVYTLGIDWTDLAGKTPEEEVRGTVRIERDAAR